MPFLEPRALQRQGGPARDFVSAGIYRENYKRAVSTRRVVAVAAYILIAEYPCKLRVCIYASYVYILRLRK